MAGHSHPHGPHRHRATGPVAGWRYGVAIGLNLLIVAVQIVAGLLLGSTALLADAGHNAADVGGLLLAGGAAWLMTRPGSPRRTWGYGKAGVLAAIMNSLPLMAASAVLAWEAVARLLVPPPAAPPGGAVMAVAAVAILVNLLSGWLLMGGDPADVNRRAAVVHLLGDAAVSAGVLVAGGLIWLTGARWIDPMASLVIVAVILAAGWGILRHSLDLALDAAPASVDVAAVRCWLTGLPGVTAVHDLHVWPVSATATALTAHLVVPDGASDALLARVHGGLAREFGIGHATVQVERTDCAGGCG